MKNKNALQVKKATILKGLAHPVRLRIVEVLAEQDMCVCDIAEMFHFDRTTISKHLALMKNIGILKDRKEGLKVFYSLRMRCLAVLLECVERVASGEEPEMTVSLYGCESLNQHHTDRED